MSTLKRGKYFNYKIIYDNTDEIKYFRTKKDIIRTHPELTDRIIYKYTCRNHKNYCPRHKRRKATTNRPYWIEKVRILIVAEDDNILRIPNNKLNN